MQYNNDSGEKDGHSGNKIQFSKVNICVRPKKIENRIKT